jgi:hypothetical protein
MQYMSNNMLYIIFGNFNSILTPKYSLARHEGRAVDDLDGASGGAVVRCAWA